jgi:hypothetical protein
MPELADVLRRHGQAYRSRYAESILPSHRRAMVDIEACRTEALGGQMYRCDRCGRSHPAYHSCRNRSCPKCHRTDTQRWLHDRQKELLPVGYFHLTFTLPPALYPLVRSHQRILHGVLMKAAAHPLMTLARDPKFLGGRIGILAVLHTWGGALNHHPHVHLLVPAGGLSPDGARWIPSHAKFLVPVRALSILFRARFLALARKALPAVHFPESVWNKKWVVYCKPAAQGSARVLQYLARYVHRIAITNARILAVDDRSVTFRYKDSRVGGRWKTMTLDGTEFLRRFLQHVLPQGSHKVRYYGFLSPSQRHLLPRIAQMIPPEEQHTDPESTVPRSAFDPPATPPPLPRPCPHCKIGRLLPAGTLPRRRAPP